MLRVETVQRKEKEIGCDAHTRQKCRLHILHHSSNYIPLVSLRRSGVDYDIDRILFHAHIWVIEPLFAGD